MPLLPSYGGVKTSVAWLARHGGVGMLRGMVVTAVVFDLYETLITRFDPDWEPPKVSVAERLGIEEEVFRRNWTSIGVRWRKGCFERFEELLEAVCEAAGIAPDRQAIAELARERREYTLMPFEHVEAEIVEMVEELRSRGLKLGVVTNSGWGDVEPWSRCRLAPYFAAFVPSCSVGHLKPDRRIYERCLEAMGANAEESVFVGDAGNEAMNESEGARNVGMRPYWATWYLDRWPPGIRRLPGPDPPFPRLRATTDLLDRV